MNDEKKLQTSSPVQDSETRAVLRVKYLERFFRKLAEDGGAIVSSNDLSAKEIDKASEEERMLVDDDGFGYIYVPID